MKMTTHGIANPLYICSTDVGWCDRLRVDRKEISGEKGGGAS